MLKISKLTRQLLTGLGASYRSEMIVPGKASHYRATVVDIESGVTLATAEAHDDNVSAPERTDLGDSEAVAIHRAAIKAQENKHDATD